MKTDVTQPPIGLIPKEHYERQRTAARFKDVCGAITRYYNANLPINVEWVEEYNELIKFKKKNNGKNKF